MPVNFNCSHYQEQPAGSEYSVGTEVQCPHCGEKTLAVPGAIDESESDPDCIRFQDGPYEDEEDDEEEDNSFDFKTIQTYFIPSFLVTFCCCFPFGIVALVFAAQTRAYKAARNIEEAERHSELAQQWVGIGVMTGVGLLLLLTFFRMLLRGYIDLIQPG